MAPLVRATVGSRRRLLWQGILEALDRIPRPKPDQGAFRMARKISFVAASSVGNLELRDENLGSQERLHGRV